MLVLLGGRLDEKGADQLRQSLPASKLSGVKTLSFDCTNLQYISSMGIGLLMSYHNSLASRGGKACLENVPKDMHRLFQTLKLDQVLHITPKV